MRSRKLVLASVSSLVATILTVALSTWAAAGPCMAEPFGC